MGGRHADTRRDGRGEGRREAIGEWETTWKGGAGRLREGGGGERHPAARTDAPTRAQISQTRARARATPTTGPVPGQSSGTTHAVAACCTRFDSHAVASSSARGASTGSRRAALAPGSCRTGWRQAPNILSLFVIPAKDRTHVGMTNNDRKIAYKRAGAPATGVGRTALVLGSPPGHKAQITTTLIVYIIVYIF